MILTPVECAILLSQWLDAAPKPEDMSEIEWTGHRVLKITEEAGEVYDAWHNMRGGNPRKLGTKTIKDVKDELADSAAVALCALEHLTGHRGMSLQLVESRMNYTVRRANLVQD